MTDPEVFAVVSLRRGATDLAVLSMFSSEERAQACAAALAAQVGDPELQYRVVALDDTKVDAS